MDKKIIYKSYITVYILLFAFLLNYRGLNAQNFRYNNFTSENGLSNNTVNCIFQDRYGFLWIGTENGLNKYDGYVFTNFHSNHSDSSSLSSDFITCITEDNSGNLWIGTNGGGLNRFIRYNQSFTHYALSKSEIYFDSKYDITSISPDDSGNIWLGTKSDGIYKFNTILNEFKNFKNGNPQYFITPSDSINTILYTGNSKLLIGTPNGLTSFDINNNSTQTYSQSEFKKFRLNSNFINSIFRDNSGKIWIGSANHGFHNFDAETGSLTSFDIFEKDNPDMNCKVSCITEDKENNLIMSTDAGYKICRFNKSNSQSEFINYDYISSKITNERVLNTLFVDCNNILWLGYKNIGLGKYNLNKPKFNLISFNTKIQKSETGKKIRSLCTDEKDNIWLASTDGLICYDKNMDFVKIYEYIHDSDINFSNYIINSVTKDGEGNIWIGTEGGGMSKFETQTEKFTIFRHTQGNSKSLKSNFIQTLFLDKDMVLWIGTEDNGLSTFDIKTNKFNTFQITVADSNHINNDNISSIFEDKSGVMWVGTHTTGLLCYDKKTDKTIRYRPDASNANSLTSDNVLSIAEDKTGILWIGTGNGLEEFDRNTESFIHYMSRDGLAYEVINSILIDDKNNLWLATNNGITKFDVREKYFRIYNIFDGLQAREFYQSGCKNMKGEFFFCGVNGVNYFYPDSIADKPNNSTLILTSFKTASNSVNYAEDICEQKEINIHHTDNSFSFSFSLLDFTNPSFYTYAFKLDGLDKEWNFTKNTRSAIYSNLEPGKYIFSVKALNSDDVWSKPISVSINISPPFWKSWWFYTLLIMGVMSVAVTNFKKIYYYKRYNKLLELDIFDKTQDLEKTNMYLQNEITERKKIEESLRYSEDQYKLIVENAIEGIIIFKDGDMVYTNSQINQILDYDFEYMSLDSFLNNIHPEDREIVESNYFRSSDDKNIKNYYSVRIRRKDFSEIIVEINSVKLPGKGKYEIIFFIKDITNRKRAEDEIRKALDKEKELSELRSRFISMTSHEFRTPLTSINTSVEILEKYSEHLTQEQKQNNLLRIQDNIQKMKRLLNDVLIIGKSDAGMYKLKLEPVDINQLCNQIIDEFHTFIMFKTKHKFKYETDNLNNRVLLDKDLIKQVIENLFTNAIKYSATGSTVFFKMNFSSRFIIFRVKDEGVGIPEGEVNNLFEPFFRASNTGNVSGSGLGLAIVKRAVELHNGRISVRSTVGKGTEFIITIPLIKVV